jgi:hypothetical protein
MRCYKTFILSYESPGIRHDALFFELHEDGSGAMIEVIGTLERGMRMESRLTLGRPEDDPDSPTNKQFVGWVHEGKYPRVLEICSRVPPPPKQLVRGKLIDPHQSLRSSKHWTKEAVYALETAGILGPV